MGVFMNRHQRPKKIQVMEIDRVKAFSDNIFGFAMTLLIIRIDLPKAPVSVASEELLKIIFSQWRPLAMYAITFLSIGGYWVLHNFIFNNVKCADRALIWLNLLLLLSVTFLPFPTMLMGKFGRDTVTASFYGITMSLNYMFLFLITWYVCGEEHLLKPDITQYQKGMLKLRIFTPLLIALIGTMLSFIYYRVSFWVYLGVVLVNSLPLTRLGRKLHITESEPENLA